MRLNIFSGKEKTYQAWYGVPENLLQSNRTFNPAGTEKVGAPYDNQTDNYNQTHYQLFFNHALNSHWWFNTALFLSRGKGYYEEYKADQSLANYGLPNIFTVTSTDLIRQRWLDNRFYGQIASLQYKKERNELTLGGGWSTYDGEHYGNIIWMKTGTVSPNYRYYNYPAIKTDANAYAKWQFTFAENWRGFADFQFRHIRHSMIGFEGNQNLVVNRSFDFLNPKVGITYHRNGVQAYISYALGNKEPNRDDFQASPISQPKQETLHDIELGIESKNANWHWGATIYQMYYINQLVLTGQINDVGAYTRKNIPKSFRRGIELEGGASINNWLALSGNLTISENKIQSFTEYIDNYDNGGQDAVYHQNTDISFSPNFIGGFTATLLPFKQFELSLVSKYVGKEYLDNSQSEQRKLNAFFVEDIKAGYTINIKGIKESRLFLQINNLFDTKYEPNGYTYVYVYNKAITTENGYYPMAGRNLMLGLNLRF